MVNNTFPERFKPRRQLFEMSRAGRLLMVSTCRHVEQDVAMTRAEALELNAIAKQIAVPRPREAHLKAHL